jgi:hypothetical protein
MFHCKPALTARNQDVMVRGIAEDFHIKPRVELAMA